MYQKLSIPTGMKRLPNKKASTHLTSNASVPGLLLQRFDLRRLQSTLSLQPLSPGLSEPLSDITATAALVTEQTPVG